MWSDALFGLLRAARSFDPSRRSASSWAAFCIDGAITDGLRARHGEVRSSGDRPATAKARARLVPLDHEHGSDLVNVDWVADRVDIATALTALPARSRAVVHAYYWQGFTLAEIATRLGVHESRVSQILTDARRRMRPFLAPGRSLHEARPHTVKVWGRFLRSGLVLVGMVTSPSAGFTIEAWTIVKCLKCSVATLTG